MNKSTIRRLVCVIFSAALIFTSICIAAGAAEDKSEYTLYINEICAKNDGDNGNTTVLVDEEGDYCDWVELYNPTDTAQNLGGWGLSDGKKNRYKYTFDAAASIPAKGVMLIYCSDAATKDGVRIAPFNISTDGEKIYLTDDVGATVDIVETPVMSKDITYSRVPDGSDKLVFTLPTPGKSNNNATVYYYPPEFSVQSGIYKDGFDLEITNPNNNDAKIYYTLDGSDPVSSKTAVEYTGKINIHDRSSEPDVLADIDPFSYSPSAKKGNINKNPVDKATVVRACVKDNDYSSLSSGATYFVGEKTSKYGEITLISLSTDYANLFDYNIGIYTKGKYYDEYKAAHPGEADYYGTKGNYSQKGDEWERPAHVDYIETDGSLAFSQNCGIRIKGAVSRSSVQKGFRFIARSKYGEKKFKYAIFDDQYDINGKLIKKYDSFTLRNGGNDVTGMRFSDAINQSLVRDAVCETQSYKPCYLFLNGEYWGTYELCTEYCADYIAEKYGVDDENILMYKNWKWEEGGDTTADKNLYNNANNFVGWQDMTNPSKYAEAQDYIDIDSFTDYMAIQIFYCNQDWPQGNFALWRVRKPENGGYGDGRWRYMIFDTDLSTGIYGNSDKMANFDKLNAVLNMSGNPLAQNLKNLLKNSDYKKKFMKRFADLCNFELSSAVTLPKIKEAYYGGGKIREYMQKNWECYPHASISSSDSRYNYLKQFYTDRPGYALKYLVSNLGSQLKTVTVTVKNAAGGKVYVNEHEVASGAKLTYPAASTLDIKAVANSGYAVDGQSSKTMSKNADDETIIIDFQPETQPTTAAPTTQPTTAAPTTQPTTAAPTTQPTTAAVTTMPTTVPTTAPTTHPTTQPTTIPTTQPTTRAIIFGDVNNDTSINAKDTLLLRKYVAKWKVTIDLAAADVTHEGTINAKDVLKLRKFIARQIKEL